MFFQPPSLFWWVALGGGGAGVRGAPGDTEPPQLVCKLVTAFAFAQGLREREGPEQEGREGPPAKQWQVDQQWSGLQCTLYVAVFEGNSCTS